jgi:rRNA maturation RNase YbeY
LESKFAAVKGDANKSLQNVRTHMTGQSRRNVTLQFTMDRDVAAMLPAPFRRKLQTQCRRMLAAVDLLERAGVASVPPLEMSMRLTGDEVMQQLNTMYRNKNKPTDVLAFAQRDAVDFVAGDSGRSGGSKRIAASANLGDIIISVPTALKQSKPPRRTPQLFDELLFLASHGLCHLIGYDHPTAKAERIMNTRMAALRVEATRGGRVRSA